MGLRINLNAAAMNTHRQVQMTDNAMSSSIEKLSSGYRINRAADDPAGLAISENLRSQLGGLGQAISNANDAVNLIRTAEGALTEVHSLLRQVRDLAVHAANVGANDSVSQAADQTQIDKAVEALNRIASQTAFGNKKLLDGSGALGATNLNPSVVSGVSVASSGSAFSTGYADLHVTTAATKAAFTFTHTGGYTGAAATVANSGTVTINGTQITIAGTDTVQQAMDKINAKQSDTGVTATLVDVGAGVMQLKLDQGSYGSDKIIAYTESADIFNEGGTNVSAGVDAVAHTVQGTTTTNFNVGKGNVLTNANGDSITLNGGGAVADSANALYMTGSSLTFQVGANANETASASISGTQASRLGSASAGYVSSINVTTASGAQSAIQICDAAITQVSQQRASLGAIQKGIESTISSLGVSKENIAASESSIRDTDMAAEMVKFTRSQILMQAGTAMLAQANQAPQSILSLLRG